MRRLLQLVLAVLLGSWGGCLHAQTYTYVDLGVAPYSDTFGQSASNDVQVGYGLVGGQPQALMWQSTAASATPLPTAISQPVGPSAANMIVIGDSITAGIGGVPQNASTGYPAVMQSLGMGQSGSLVYNFGMPGETIGNMLGQYSGATGSTSVTTTVTTTSGGTSATIGNATGVSIGMSIGAAGIPPNTTISAITGTSITLSNKATTSDNAVTCSIATPVQDISVGTSDYPGGAANSWSNFTNTAHQMSYVVQGKPCYAFILAGTNDIVSLGVPVYYTCTVGSPNVTVTGGNSNQYANGDVFTGPDFSSANPPIIVSGAGTTSMVLSSNANDSATSEGYVYTPATPLATAEANYAALVSAAHADGDTIANGGGVIAMTLLPRGNSTNISDVANNITLTAFNAWLKSGASGADYIFDANSALPPFGPATSSAYYVGDQLHLTAEGTSVLGSYINQQFFAQVDTAANNYQNAEALGIVSTFAAGYGINSQGQSNALYWAGLTQPPVNMNPSFAKSSVANGIGGFTADLGEAGSAILSTTGQQVAVQWFGTAAGAENINPTGATSSQAFAALSYGIDAGSAVFSGATHAVFWQSTGPTDLNPTGALRSEALGIGGYFTTTGTLKEVEVGDYTTSGGAMHACYWTGTASGMVDIHPATGYTSTTALNIMSGLTLSTTYSGAVVGYGTKTNGTTVALLWNGTSLATVTDLSTYLPVGTTSSRAMAIDAQDFAGGLGTPFVPTIIGYATINGSNHAFLLRPSVAPAFESPAQALKTIVGVPYTWTIVIKGFPTPTYSMTGTLPPGLSISSTTGVISGTPTQTGTFTGTIVATNAGGSLSQRFSIQVVAAPAFSQVSIIGSLNPANGTGLHQSMVLGPDGNFYGTCTTGGVLNTGTVFKMTPAGVETTVHSFGDGSVNYDGTQPQGLSFGVDGTLYGTTYAGGSAGNGTVFNLNQGTSTETILHNFGDGSVSNDGANPATSMLQATDGNFYGMTKFGGASSDGTMFSMAPMATTFSKLTDFGGTSPDQDAVFPDTPLIQASSGLTFYGTTITGPNFTTGPATIRGGVFTATTSGEQGILKAFDTSVPPFLGFAPHSPLRLGTDGNLYGIASAGGLSYENGTLTSDPTNYLIFGIGTVYKLTTSGTQTDIHNFGDGTVGNDGANTAEPDAPLVQGADGNFYGVTPAGGSYNEGCLFQISTSGTMQVVHSFGDGTVPNDGTDPGPVFFLGPDGYTFYGITQKGGVNGDGVIYKYNIGVAPAVIRGTIPKCFVGVPYNYTPTVTGYPSPTVTLTSGPLPPGLTLSSSGQITGTPTTAGSYPFQITASNGVGSGATLSTGILVNTPAAFTDGPPSTSIPVGVPYTFTYTATGSPTPALSVTTGSLPTGLTFSGGVISGTPTTLGLYTGVVTASQLGLPMATQNFSITVTNTYANWAAQAGLTGQSAAQNTVLEPDGLTNLMKYALGLNPTTIYNPGSTSLPYVQMSSNNQYLTLTFTGVASDVTYTVQAANSPNGPWSPIATYSDVYPAPGTVTVQDTQPVSNSSARYMQLQVTSP